VLVLIVFGVGKLPQIGGAIGKSIKEFRKEKDGNSQGQPQPALPEATSQPEAKA